MKSEWIWFDLDDTLVDFHANSRLAHSLIYDECNLDRFYPSREEWIETYESHNKKLWDAYSRAEITQKFLRADRFATPLRPYWDSTEEKLQEFAAMLDPLYLTRLAEQTVMIDGAMDLLDYLRVREYNIGVLSNGFKDVQHRKLINTGLAPMIDLVVLSDDIGINKPDTRLYAYAMQRAGVTAPSHHTMIGDNPATDIAGAINAGWNAILLDPAATELKPDGQFLVTPKLCRLKELF
ncbi:MAG: YjjG family noncanonical pyrimidine nucleotidase [Bacteroides sp.]|nr:YjjG family noncanonical pyrimidine nucleotidase [Bacteroides sp.]